MSCPVCGRIYCDHTPSERGQTQDEMIADITPSPKPQKPTMKQSEVGEKQEKKAQQPTR